MDISVMRYVFFSKLKKNETTTTMAVTTTKFSIEGTEQILSNFTMIDFIT